MFFFRVSSVPRLAKCFYLLPLTLLLGVGYSSSLFGEPTKGNHAGPPAKVQVRRTSEVIHKPNILLIMTDDQGYGDLGFHGNKKIDTPVLDRLATQSVRFEHFYVCPYCSPTRATLLTGRYSLRTGSASVTRGLEAVRSEEVTIAEVLRTAGYATGCFGKWHIGEHYPSHPNGQGFEEFFGFPHGHWDNYFNPRLQHNSQWVQTKGFITDVITDYALRFIQQHRNQPFFCYVPYNAPHTPLQVPDRYFDKYVTRGLDPRTAAIYGLVENVDENIGRLLCKLDDLNLTKQTVVFFLSDNGPEGREGSRYNAGMRGMKGSVHEGGMRVPLFVRWPGHFKANRVVQPVAAHIDLLPTIAELCGVSKPGDSSASNEQGASNNGPSASEASARNRSIRGDNKNGDEASLGKTLPLDGRSLVPLLMGQNWQWPNRMLFSRSAGWRRMVEYRDPVIKNLLPYAGTVRTQRWRAVNEGDGWQLYDMLNDPSEKQDVAGEYPNLVSQFDTAYDRWFTDTTSTPIVRPPIPVGYTQWPKVELPASNAYTNGSIRWYNKYGFAHDWLTGWTDVDDTIHWDIDVVTAGQYEITLQYTCLPEAVGTRLRVETNGAHVEGKILRDYNPEPKQRPTRSPKKRFTQTFTTQLLGKLSLEKGRQHITLRALTKPADRVCDLRSLTVRLVEQ